jgi:plasmid stabilization system protein ParE
VILEFHPAAQDEFAAAAEYYETAVPGLGSRFLVAVRRMTEIALQHPDAGSHRGDSARKLVVTGFPYDVVYRVRGDVVSILAVAHHHRRPGFWRGREQG